MYALLDKNKSGTKNFFIGYMCGSKVGKPVYRTLPHTQHNSIPNILDNNLRRTFLIEIIKKIILSNESLSRRKRKITSQTLLFNILEKFNFNSMSIEKFFRELKKKSVYSK